MGDWTWRSVDLELCDLETGELCSFPRLPRRASTELAPRARLRRPTSRARCCASRGGYLRDADEAEDAVQDVCARLLGADASPESSRAWIYRVAGNVCSNRLRARHVRGGGARSVPSSFDPPEERTGALARLVRSEDAERLRADLALLWEAQREAVLLRCVEGLARDEVAAVLDVTVAVAKSRIYGGLESLRRAASRREPIDPR